MFKTNFRVEVVENNLRMIKLVFPVKLKTAWAGNIYIPAQIDDKLKWLWNWNYVYAYIRKQGKHKIFVLLNLSGKAQTISITNKKLLGKTFAIFENKEVILNSNAFQMKPWGYEIYEY